MQTLHCIIQKEKDTMKILKLTPRSVHIIYQMQYLIRIPLQALILLHKNG